MAVAIIRSSKSKSSSVQGAGRLAKRSLLASRLASVASTLSANSRSKKAECESFSLRVLKLLRKHLSGRLQAQVAEVLPELLVEALPGDHCAACSA
jgi:hypothetical protein